jgi:hypothetical protein
MFRIQIHTQVEPYLPMEEAGHTHPFLAKAGLAGAGCSSRQHTFGLYCHSCGLYLPRPGDT